MAAAASVCAVAPSSPVLASSPPVCTLISSDAMAPTAHRKPRRTQDSSISVMKTVPDFSNMSAMTRTVKTGLKHLRSLEARADGAGGPVAENIPHAPPPYTPSISLHAGTATAGSYPAVPTSSTSSSSGGPITDGNESHRTNLPLLITGLLVGTLLLGVSFAIVRFLFKQHTKKRRAARPKFSMLKTASPKDTLSMSSSFGNFVLLATSEGDVAATALERHLQSGSVVLSEDEKRELRVVNAPDVRRYSSMTTLEGAPPYRPHDCELLASETAPSIPPRDWGLPILTTSVSAPASPLLTPKDISLHVQRQKAAELEQIVRMKFVREELLPGTRASCPELTTPALDAGRRPSPAHGLHILHARESEVDIASTALCALDRYAVAFDPASPTVPVSRLFQVARDGRVVRLASPAASPLTPASGVVPTPPPSGAPDTASRAEEDDMTDVEDAVIVRAGRAHSVEVQRGVLVAVHTSATPSGSYFAARPHSTGALPAVVPTLSPIVTSPTSLSADIEEVLEERVFAYRESGPWSKENYRLTTPGQVRALTEALALARPAAVQQQQKPWPWPAHRSAFADLDDEATLPHVSSSTVNPV
ncbi:hypothetical protein PHLGIDRAFT_379288 [Phlebiopsis gigantea 11061_1 CR5-6]|uniref:Uncharacterized protein n=1 Tax=Phlebiopsis gigantea (strain 11061_1 CR5-6) TaxID=745531 RepID=A0A0C3SC42_PHLG1|nr:hypothetical protein PHLGIDRAFT_379288 [Phlebiopsis gigantea 11061_1 CR5-6]